MTEKVANVVELVKELDEKEILELIRQLMKDNILFDDYEDIQDTILIEARRNEPTTKFSDFLEELRKEGRPV
ncbi:hypothetical protein K9N50_04455 [bacterium]|nr:hypothetical protein [bacterium]